ncbi:aminoglycoside phosphotransferase family protein [Paludibacterium purpuratum]|uniref:Streptomycin 6-kinase n=1 Tax=Paludibacterium purpuratum TaxID=1144873 RepID=A0A4R7BBJ9_9NEIS|nr:aminoglycoside phosphotransferase family protein [Paludibacterium purpuratum]TDR82261.1 streptomycin 6-kinase [Paludibacterium purpuratum]
MPGSFPSDLLARYIAHWQLKADGVPFYTASSALRPVYWRGQPAMLKIALNEEEARGNRMMAWWDGRQAARVFGQHGPALLMERLSPTPSLTVMAQSDADEESVRILCRTAAGLHRLGADPQPVLVPLSQWFRALLDEAERHEIAVGQAARLAVSLLERQQDVVALHGDLHHGNVMHSAARGWLAIDPKGLYGERTFDYANLFCNPAPEVVRAPGRFERRLALVSAEAGLERVRLLSWIAAWAGLSTVWHRQDGDDDSAARFILDVALGALAGTLL